MEERFNADDGAPFGLAPSDDDEDDEDDEEDREKNQLVTVSNCHNYHSRITLP